MKGIYQILNTENGKNYIGSAVDIERRWRDHKTRLNHNKHFNPHLQSAWNKYSKDSFEFEVLLCWKKNSDLLWLEQWYLDNWEPEYNISTCATAPTLGLKHSKEAKKKMSVTATGRVFSEETKKKLSEYMKGRRAGESNSNSKLKECEVLEIRRLHSTERVTQTMLSKMFKINRHHVGNIVNMKSWKHL